MRLTGCVPADVIKVSRPTVQLGMFLLAGRIREQIHCNCSNCSGIDHDAALWQRIDYIVIQYSVDRALWSGSVMQIQLASRDAAPIILDHASSRLTQAGRTARPSGRHHGLPTSLSLRVVQGTATTMAGRADLTTRRHTFLASWRLARDHQTTP